MESIRIGNQVWCKTDLKVTHFRNGDPIPQVESDKVWARLRSAAFCITEEGHFLYNWYAVVDRRGLAPEGFHIPSDSEWFELIGPVFNDTNAKSDSFQLAIRRMESLGPVFCGGRDHDEGFFDLPQTSCWWSTTHDYVCEGKSAWSLFYSKIVGGFRRYPVNWGRGMSVRCLKNEETWLGPEWDDNDVGLFITLPISTRIDKTDNAAPEMDGDGSVIVRDDGTSITYCGKSYSVLKIGSQQWLGKELKTKWFRNGDPIPYVEDYRDWGELFSAGYCITPDGKYLYNWFAVMDSRGLAPKGFHIPSDEEWQCLVEELGGDDVAGKKLKKKKWGGNNRSGFGARPIGLRLDEDEALGNDFYEGDNDWFVDEDEGCFWWTSTSLGEEEAVYRSISIDSDEVGRNDEYDGRKGCGLSVRCVRDYGN